MTSHPFDLQGKVALVTGGNVGLGQGIAVALAQAGADIVSVARRPSEETGEQVRALGRRFLSIEADLGTLEPIPQLLARTLEEMGGLHVLVNNAGIIRRADAVDFSEEDWDAVMNVNLKGTFFLTQAVGKHFIAQGGGKVINIASMLSFQGGIRVPSYTASKSGVMGITRLMANEWASHGINVNAIAPGVVDGEHWDGVDALFAKYENRPLGEKKKLVGAEVPYGRMGTAEDLTGMAIFLASAESDYVVSQTYNVDGGNWMS